MQEPSWNTVKIIFLDGPKAVAGLRRLAGDLLQRDPRVLRVVLFGSLAKGNYGARSDGDLCVVLLEDPRPRWIDRIPEYIGAFHGADVPVDLFIYTEAELDRMRANENGLVKAIDKDGVILAERGRAAL